MSFSRSLYAFAASFCCCLSFSSVSLRSLYLRSQSFCAFRLFVVCAMLVSLVFNSRILSSIRFSSAGSGVCRLVFCLAVSFRAICLNMRVICSGMSVLNCC